MGKGDKKSRRGKIIMGSFGVSRPKSSKSKGSVPAAPVEAEENVTMVSEKPKAEPKPKVAKVADVAEVAAGEAEAAPKKAAKKAVKKTEG
jgi:30S ribosomal protein S31